MSNDDDQLKFKNWLKDQEIQDVEVVVNDLAGISRGKMMPVEKFIEALGTDQLRMPESLFGMRVDCDFILNDHITVQEEDIFLQPDFSTAGIVPWQERKTAFFICDLLDKNGQAFSLYPRQLLKNVLALYAEKGWQPIVAPEFEFSLLDQNLDAQQPAEPVPPKGRSGNSVLFRGVLSLDGMAEFGSLFDDVRNYCEAMGLNVDTLVNEAGIGQFECNVSHGEPVRMADTAFLFKRIMKWAAVKHGYHASFMAKPYPADFGNSMHLHQSVVDTESGDNVFAGEDGRDSALFLAHVAGLQKYAAAAMPFFAPYENSYLRLSGKMSSPTNTHWGPENRSVGLRVPEGGRQARRIENRIAGADVNPYLVTAASLLCGYLGMVENLKPSNPVSGSAYEQEENRLPGHFHAGLEALDQCEAFRKVMGDAFVTTYVDVKKAELAARNQVISRWDLDYLLMNV